MKKSDYWPKAEKDFLIIRASSLPLARLFLFRRCLSRGCFFCEIEGCSRPAGGISQLQLITFYDNWENVEARTLYRRGILVLGVQVCLFSSDNKSPR